MIRCDGVTSRKVSDGAGDFQDPVIGTGAEVEIGHCVLEKFIAPVIETAMLLEVCMGHPGIAGDFFRFGKTPLLDPSGPDDPFPDRGRGFGGYRVGEFLVLDGWCLDMKVDPKFLTRNGFIIKKSPF